MRKIICDRCGEEISGNSGYISVHGAEEIRKIYMKSLHKKEFCRECLAEIVNFALNKNACDECVQQMMKENAMLREDDEKAGSGNSEPDPGQFTAGADRVETGRPCIQYIASIMEVAEAMRSIRRERQCQSGLS